MTVWTPELDDALTALWSDPALSCTAIGVRLGLTKNSVCGRIGRLGLRRRGSPLGHAVVAARAAKPPPPRKPAARKAPAVAVAPPAVAYRPPVVGSTVTCQYPEWGFRERPTHRYCGASSVRGSSWCPSHFAACHAGWAAR